MISCDQNDDNGISNLEERESKCIYTVGILLSKVVKLLKTYDFKTPQYGPKK